MASTADLIKLKRIAPVGEFTDAELGLLFDTQGINGAAAEMWAAEAKATSALVDITESGSSRKNSQAHTTAKEMLELYSNLVAAEQEVLPGTGRTAFSRTMTR
jgi:hypothetical protein